MDKETILNNIFESDPLGLLEIKAKNPVITADDRLIATFEEINDFYEKNNWLACPEPRPQIYPVKDAPGPREHPPE